MSLTLAQDAILLARYGVASLLTSVVEISNHFIKYC